MAINNGLALPNPLSNGTTADAVPVMADFNYLLSALNRALLDQGGTSGMNANATQIHNLANGTLPNDVVNLSQLGAYLPLAGGALTGGLTGTTLSLSSTLSVTGAATLAALTASGLITGNAGFSGTTLSLSGAATLSGGATVTAPGGSTPALTLNGSGTDSVVLKLADTSNPAGANIQLTGNGATTPNKYLRAFSGALEVVNSAYSATILHLDDSGNLSAIASLSSTGSLSAGGALSVTGAATLAALTASGLITGNAGFSGTTLSLSGAATLSGGGTSTTPAYGDSTTKIATTAFVQAAKAPNVQTVASASTVTPTFSNDAVNITAQAAALTLANPSGTAVDEWGWLIRVKDNGTPQTIAYGTQYTGIGFTLPTTTVAGKVLVLGCVYNAALGRVEVLSTAQE